MRSFLPAALLLLATPAAPVVLEVVDGQTGEAVAGVQYVLEDGTGGETDDQGRADVPEGSRVVLESEDHAVGVVEVGREDQTTALWPLVGWMVQNPGRGMGGLAFGPLYIGQWSDDLQLDDIDLAVTLNGSPTSTGSTDPGVLNDQRDLEFEFHAVAGHIALGMPRFEIGPVKLFPAVSGTLGRGYLDFDNLSSSDGSGSRFDAEGVLWGLGADLVMLPCSECPAFLGIAYDFRQLEDDGVRHRFDLPSGALLLEEDAEISYRQHLLSVRAGTSLLDDHVSPYAGIQIDFSELIVHADSVQLVPSTPTSAIAVIDQRFRISPAHALHGLAGVDMRLWRLPIFLRAETSFNDQDIHVSTKLVLLFDTEMVRRRAF